MTLDELVVRRSMRDNDARYNDAGDRGRIDYLPAFFAVDSVVEAKGELVATGRREIVAALTNVTKQVPRADTLPPGACHIMCLHVCDRTAVPVGQTRTR